MTKDEFHKQAMIAAMSAIIAKHPPRTTQMGTQIPGRPETFVSYLTEEEERVHALRHEAVAAGAKLYADALVKEAGL